MRPDKRRPMLGIPQDIFAVLWRAEKNAKSRKRSQAMVRRMQLCALPPYLCSQMDATLD